MSKKLEKELKFRLKKLPENLINPVNIEQTYLAFGSNGLRKMINKLFVNEIIKWENIVEVRIRKKSSSYANSVGYFLTLKSDGSLERDEYETILSESIYQKFYQLIHIGKINKIRYTINIKDTDLDIEIDQYGGFLEGLYMAEIEYTNEDRNVITEKAIEYLGKDIIDVTENKKYKNRNLSTLESIDKL